MENKTVSGISNNTIKQQQSCAINMRYFGIRDQKMLENFLIAWKSGQENPADCFTKHHFENHHKCVCLIYLQTNKTPHSVPLVLIQTYLQGYVDPEDSNIG